MNLLKGAKHQWILWRVALGFFTRIKLKPIDNFEPQWLNQASRYYGLVGLLIGVVAALVYALSVTIVPASIAIILAMIATVLLTGGFHEDGLADTWDGFGGGWTVEQKLTIMKDSRLGTYGALALFLTLLLKFQLLIELTHTTSLTTPLNNVMLALIVAHCISRVIAVSLIYDQPYVRDIDSSKIKPMTEQQNTVELVILILSGLAVLSFLPLTLAVLIVGLQLLLRFGIVNWYRAQLGGYTGDLLGQAQQLSELLIYVILLVYASHIL